jgi:hypothetical protein
MAGDSGTICFTVDVEWAHPAVLQDVRDLFDMHGVRATFFCTHAGIDVGPHERGLHPNYRRNGTALSELGARIGPAAMAEVVEGDLYRHVLRTTLDFAPEAKGARSHSLFYDSQMIPVRHDKSAAAASPRSPAIPRICSRAAKPRSDADRPPRGSTFSPPARRSRPRR